MLIPFVLFWVLVVVARQELGIKGVAAAVAAWIGLLLGFMFAGFSPALFVSAQALLDVALLLMVFGEDINIR